MRVLCCEMALVCQKLASQLQNTLPNGVFPTKWRISCFGGSQPRNGGSCAAKWHSCAKSGFAAAKIFAERVIGLRTGFAAKCRFRRGCEISQTPVFAPFDSDFAPILLRKTSFNFFTIPLDFDHPKTYITSKQT
ncbi:hypothetical protein VitviT2T_028636 [Vitis vinifera]|uniref:Uncharacterized protein n=1 Tax=Vitis vinifera TaxID=29760 RepID=A0ABY9DVB5_VITVI|nr:hypothetical protein VitviT2T_028636 [Vitis vinifera]